MQFVNSSRHLLGAFIGISLVGCASTPLPELPESDIPQSWQRADLQEDLWPELNWWHNFGSSELTSLMTQVEAKNLDLQNNERNLRQARLALTDAGFDLWPTPIVDLGAAKQYSGSEPRGGSYSDSTTEDLDLSVSLIYTDILGKPDAYSAARARYDSSVALAADTRLNTLGTAASTYFRILLLRDRVDAARQNLENAEAIVRIVEARVKAGTALKVDLLQQQIAVQRQRNNLSSLLQDELAARSALALLVADSVQRFTIQTSSLSGISIPQVEPGLPSELLVRRPDIVQAEANMRISRANVDLARTAFLPDISLTGSAGLFSDAFVNLIDEGTTSVTATASLVQTLIDNGARLRDLEGARLELESALADYRETVIGAFNEIEVSLGNIALLRALGVVAVEDLKRAQESFRIAEVRYREGVADYQTLLQTQNSLFDTRNAALDNKLAQLNAIISFYQSLGGGWQMSPGKS